MERKKSNWLRAMEYSQVANLSLVVLLSFIFSFYVFFDDRVNYYHDIIDFIAFFFMSIFFVGQASILITLFSTGLLGAPTVYLLILLELDKPIYAAVIGALTVYIVMFISNMQHEWYYLFYCFFGFVAGYAFMYGYNKEEQS